MLLLACSCNIRQVGGPPVLQLTELPLTIHCTPEALPDALSSRASINLLAPWRGALNFHRVLDIVSLRPCSNERNLGTQ